MIKRRVFLKNLARLSGVGALTGLYTWQIEPFWLEFVQRELPIQHLPPHLEGKTLIQISDMHVGNRFDWHFIIKSLQKAQTFNPDFVVYTGDYISYLNEQQFAQLRQVLKHVLKGKLGTIGILGNHDYGLNWSQNEVAQQVVTLLQEVGVQMLRNEQTNISGLNFIGFDDYWATNFQPQKALRNYNSGQANVLLCHNPDVCDLDVWQGYQGWILAGHTHGGQCKAPFLTPPMLPVQNKMYTSGEFNLGDGRWLYINRALGHLWQVRFNVRPEITVFTLRKFL